MPDEKRLVDRHALEAADRLTGSHRNHAVHEQKGETMRQVIQDLFDVHFRLNPPFARHTRPAHSRPRSRRARRFAIASSSPNLSAFRRHSRFAAAGIPPEYTPGRSIERATCVIAPTTTRSTISTGPSPAIPTPPASTQCRPTRVLPAMPTHPQISVWSPITQL